MYKVVKTDAGTGFHIARVQVGGVVFFLKDRDGNIIAHGKYREMLDYFKYLTR